MLTYQYLSGANQNDAANSRVSRIQHGTTTLVNYSYLGTGTVVGTAMEQLIGILRLDLNHADGATKKLLLDTIFSLGKGDPLAAEYQRKLYSLLY